ncbi:hypothetical protein DPMN_066367 [Dreissena polymorpha]|uniref:Uncharacterized protein n=1 Tax=Dreissena polymorpha TaxID=45954 RepID=A0A9D3YX76_DREPO|nr:hypothetical protein DPMN_066367 [Dreissena polymorpha]
MIEKFKTTDNSPKLLRDALHATEKQSEMMAMMMPKKINPCTHGIKKINVCTCKIEITENYHKLKNHRCSKREKRTQRTVL